jgi:hypothetical protein
METYCHHCGIHLTNHIKLRMGRAQYAFCSTRCMKEFRGACLCDYCVYLRNLHQSPPYIYTLTASDRQTITNIRTQV